LLLKKPPQARPPQAFGFRWFCWQSSRLLSLLTKPGNGTKGKGSGKPLPFFVSCGTVLGQA
jgi:hypothetical protein